MLKVNSKDTRTKPYFTPCSIVSVVNFEQVNIGWVYSIQMNISCKLNLTRMEIFKLHFIIKYEKRNWFFDEYNRIFRLVRKQNFPKN